jgi:WD40 repeat protein
VWETITGKKIVHMTHKGVNSVAFSSDGQYVVSGDYDGAVHVWKTFTGVEIAHIMAH